MFIPSCLPDYVLVQQADQKALVDERAKAKERIRQQKIDAATAQKKLKVQQMQKLKEIKAQMKVRACALSFWMRAVTSSKSQRYALLSITYVHAPNCPPTPQADENAAKVAKKAAR